MNKIALAPLILLAGCTASVPRPSGSVASISLPTFKYSIRVPDRLASLYLQYQIELQAGLSGELASTFLSSGDTCSLDVFQLPGGEIFKVDFLQCQFSPHEQEQIRSRLVGTQLPYKGFEAVFNRQLLVNVCARAAQCDL
jgi:hypothetical protein